MQEHAEVIRLEPQLTVPTRNRAHLSDVWIAIASRTRLTVWADALQSVSHSYHTWRSGAGTVQLVCMSDHRGWIVERGADLSVCSTSDVEKSVRELVALANRVVCPRSTISPSMATEMPWGYRVRLALAASRNAAMIVASVPIRRAKVDASSAG